MPYKDPEKRREYSRKHYEENKPVYAERDAKARRKLREQVNRLKEKPCTDCGKEYPYYVMQFDHIGTDKVADVKTLVRSAGIKRVLEEIAKCELVCANCHAERTWQRQNNMLL